MDVRPVKNTTKEHMMEVISRHIKNNPVRGKVTLEVVGEHAMVPSKTEPEFYLSRAAVRVADSRTVIPSAKPQHSLPN